MAFDRTHMIEKASMRLSLHGYSAVDLSVLHEVARWENQTLREKLKPRIDSGHLPVTNPEWMRTYCYAGPPRIAKERGLSERAVRRSLAILKIDGLIEVVDHGYRQYRRLNVAAFAALDRGEDSTALYSVYKRAKSTNPLGPLYWSRYMVDADVPESLPLLDHIIEKVNSAPYKRYFASTWERAQYSLAIRKIENADGLNVDEGIDKASDADRLDSALPHLLITKPDVAERDRVVEGFAYRSQSSGRMAADDEDDYDDAA